MSHVNLVSGSIPEKHGNDFTEELVYPTMTVAKKESIYLDNR
jgi:hypothetical protein